ncbi:NAD(P)H-binding protein, partial [Aeromicrobium sp.]|uniref:NAD(P)H-binding protein n=1 Tax=Aeromicrobium sp. TaxID=1871063 RepID=UPI002FC6BFF5
MSYVVIGATGQLGTLTVSSLLDRGISPDQIVAAGRNNEKLAELAELGVRTHQIDLSDRASLDGLFSSEDTVLLISSNELGQRVAQHGNAIDAAKAAGVRRIVYTSAPKASTSALVLAPEHKAT